MLYKRRISGEEEKGNFILVLKNVLAQFPNINEEFSIKFKGREFPCKIVAVSCECMGADKPHVHYYLACRGIKLERSDRITIEKKPDGEFYLEIRKAWE